MLQGSGRSMGCRCGFLLRYSHATAFTWIAVQCHRSFQLMATLRHPVTPFACRSGRVLQTKFVRLCGDDDELLTCGDDG